MRRKPQQPHAGGTLGPREASASLSKPVLYTSTTLAKNLGKKTRIKKRMAFYAVISDYFSAWKFADPIGVGDQIFLGVSSGPCPPCLQRALFPLHRKKLLSPLLFSEAGLWEGKIFSRVGLRDPWRLETAWPLKYLVPLKYSAPIGRNIPLL